MIVAATISITLLILLVVFQILLAAGAPFGHFAWGGQHKTLPRKLRVSSALSIVIYVMFALFILSRAGIWQLIPQGSFLDISLWVMGGYLVIGVLMNAMSHSKPERYVMTPTALILAVCMLIIASS